MERKSKSKPARKAAAKSAVKRKTTPPKASSAKAVAKKKAAGKPVARKGASARAGQCGPATKRAKPRNIFAKTKESAKPKAKTRSAENKSDQNSVTQNVPLIEALDRALSSHMPEPAAVAGDRHNNTGSDQDRAPAWRPSLGESGQEPADTPVRVNKLVPTNAVHTTKRRMKRNTWQSPVLGLGAVVAVLAVLVLGNNNEPPDVSPLERRVEARPSAPLPQTAQTPRTQDPSRTIQPILPPIRTSAVSQEPDSPRGLRVLELVEMERMLARLEMDPSQPDGVVDQQTETAIRTYQQLAGLPVDGEATLELLDDMREVVEMMDGSN